MDLHSELRCDTLIVSVPDSRIDAAISLQFKESMRRVTEKSPGRVVLNLEHVEFVDSSGLGAIVGAMKHLDKRATLEISGLTPTVAKVFQLTRMDSIFAIHPDLEVALKGTGP